MSRTYVELGKAALAQRSRLIDEGHDPQAGVFPCSSEEYTLLLLNARNFTLKQDPVNGRVTHICGMRIETPI